METNKKEQIICFNCDTVFIAYKSQKRKFCCHKCSLEFNNKFLPKFSKGHIPANKGIKGYKNRGTFLSGKSHRNYKHGKYRNDKKCIDCKTPISRNNALRCDICNSKHYSGNNHPMYGITFKARHIKYNSQWFRSSWEANFAKWCDLSGIKWEYEPKAFEMVIEGKETTYTPDFYLPEFDCWIEVKGRWIGNAKEKFDEFLKQYPKINIYIFDKNKLNEFSIIK